MSPDVAAGGTEQNDKTIYSELSKEMINFEQDDNFNLRSSFPNINIRGSDVDQSDHAKLAGPFLKI